MNPTEPHRHIPMPGEPRGPEERHLFPLSGGMTLEDLRQWQEMLMINQMMAMNPLMAASGQQKIPLVPSSFEPPAVERDVLSSIAVAADPRQFCVPSPFGSPVSQNANMPNLLSSHVYSGWGVLAPESFKAMARRNEVTRRQHTARVEMHAIYQKRRAEKADAKRTGELGDPLFSGPCVPAGLAGYPCRSMIPPRDLLFPRSLQASPVLAAGGPHCPESWGQKYRRLRRAVGNHRVLCSGAQSPRRPAVSPPAHLEEQTLQARANSREEDEFAKDAEPDSVHGQKSEPVQEKPTVPCDNTCGEPQAPHRSPWDARDTLLAPKAAGKKGPEQGIARGSERDGVCLPAASALPGSHALGPVSDSMSLDEDIQKWTVSDVYNFISGLPGCSDYAQVFQDHAIDGETLPLLSEEHLRTTMGLKLGPALKIQSQVSQHVERVVYRKRLLHRTRAKQMADQTADPRRLLDFTVWSDTLDVPCSQDLIAPKGTEQEGERN